MILLILDPRRSLNRKALRPSARLWALGPGGFNVAPTALAAVQSTATGTRPCQGAAVVVGSAMGEAPSSASVEGIKKSEVDDNLRVVDYTQEKIAKAPHSAGGHATGGASCAGGRKDDTRAGPTPGVDGLLWPGARAVRGRGQQPSCSQRVVAAEAILSHVGDASTQQVMMRDRLRRRLHPRRRRRVRRERRGKAPVPRLRRAPLVTPLGEPPHRARLAKGNGPRLASDGVRSPGGPRRRPREGAHRRTPKRVCRRRGSAGLVARLPHELRACCMSLSTAAKVLTVEMSPGDATWGASYMAWAAYAARGARIKSRSVSHGGRESWPPCRCTDNSSARGVKIPMG